MPQQQPLPPRSTKELGRLASVQMDTNTPIRLYFRSADLLIKQARVYKMEKDYQHAYVLYMKYTNLGIKELPRHPQYKAPENKKARIIIKKNCMEALDALEVMNPILTREYDQYVERQQEQGQRQRQQQQHDIDTRHAQQLKGITAQNKFDVDTDTTQQVGGEQWSLQNALKDVAGVGNDDRSYLVEETATGSITEYPTGTFENKSDGYSYQSHNQKSYQNVSTSVQPPIPSKPPLTDTRTSNQAPIIPPKISLESPSRQESPVPVPALPPKVKMVPDPAPLPELQNSSGATTERGEPLRRLIVPKSLQEKFLHIAKPNTNKNIETCGILAGTLKNNVLQVTTLIIPKQSGTSDTCTTENEEELFEYQDTHDLLTFGWIHTHPSQSCFLSSLDLHTHCSYQLMLPEAIAIVCAPKQNPSYGVFRLTDPPGLDVISSCKIERAFHPHPDLPIYTDTHNTSHVLNQAQELHVVDLRR